MKSNSHQIKPLLTHVQISTCITKLMHGIWWEWAGIYESYLKFNLRTQDLYKSTKDEIFLQALKLKIKLSLEKFWYGFCRAFDKDCFDIKIFEFQWLDWENF